LRTSNPSSVALKAVISMICKLVRKGAKELATVVFMMADGLGMIDIESIRETGMQAICGTSCCAAKTMHPTVERMKKLKADVKETEDTVIVTIEVPGVEKEDLDITATDDSLSIRAKAAVETKGECEPEYNMLGRDIKLHCGIKREEGKATYHNGLLKIMLPKEAAIPRVKIGVE
jgi:HSP20 family molecular chaperone IbpA